MSSSLELSKRLRALDDEQLAALIERRVQSSTGIADYFDLADVLLSPASLQLALQRCTTAELAELVNAYGQFTPRVNARVGQELLGPGTGTLYPEVASYLSTLTLPPVTVETATAVETVSPVQAAAAMEFSFSTLSGVEELLVLLEQQPAKRLAKGSLTSPEAQRLSSAVPSAEFNPEQVLSLARRAGLATAVPGWWIPGPNAPSWQELPVAQKWLALATGLMETVPEEVVTLLATHNHWDTTLQRWVEVNYPLGHDWLDADLSDALVHAQLLGLTHNEVVTPIGTAVLRGDEDTVAALLAQSIPPYASTVFVQLDYTVIAPGPLQPEDDRFMRMLCSVESRGLASTFRITHAGITETIAAGFSSDDIVAKLTDLAGTTLPQAVTYLITETGKRYGSLRVQAEGHHCLIQADDSLVAQTIAADRSLSMLNISTVDEHTLRCGHNAEIVLHALREAKYPAQLVDETGQIIQPAAAPVVPNVQLSPPSPAEVLISRLRGSREESTTDDATWIARQLDLAVRNKTALVVTVNMPDGPRDFTVEPRVFSNGRFRCLDRNTDVERTLPASHITGVRFA